MPNNEDVPEVLRTRVEVLRQANRRIVVAIDGRGGAGKSSLARHLVTSAPSAFHIEYDWFHLPRKQVTATQRFDHDRVIRQVLEPFRANQPTLTFSKYNWGYLAGVEDGFDSAPVTMCSAETLVLEGCQTLHPRLMPFYDVCVWLDTGAEEALRRGIQRDIEEYGLDPIRVRADWVDWAEWECAELASDDRKHRAELIL